MNDVVAGEEVPEAPPPEGVASPMPPCFFWTIWIPVFAVVVWGMQLLFGGRNLADPNQ